VFTGLIREIGTVVDDRNHILTIRSSLRPEVGDSIAVNGVCLTVTQILPDGFRVEAADETRRVVPPEKLRGRVHLEPAMRMGDRFGPQSGADGEDVVSVVDDGSDLTDQAGKHGALLWL